MHGFFWNADKLLSNNSNNFKQQETWLWFKDEILFVTFVKRYFWNLKYFISSFVSINKKVASVAVISWKVKNKQHFAMKSPVFFSLISSWWCFLECKHFGSGNGCWKLSKEDIPLQRMVSRCNIHSWWLCPQCQRSIFEHVVCEDTYFPMI